MPTTGSTLIEQELAKTGLIVAADRHAAPPMGPAGPGLDAVPVEVDPGVVVADPASGIAGANRPHDGVAEHLGEWATEQMEQRQR